MKLNKTLAGFHLGIGLFYLCALIFVTFFAFLEKSGKADIVSIIFYIVFIAIIALHFKAYVEVKKGTQLGRTLSRILGFILLFGFPIGTLIGWMILGYANDKEWQPNNSNIE